MQQHNYLHTFCIINQEQENLESMVQHKNVDLLLCSGEVNCVSKEGIL